MSVVRIGDRFRVNLSTEKGELPLWAPCTCVQVSPYWFRVRHDVYGYSICFVHHAINEGRTIKRVE